MFDKKVFETHHHHDNSVRFPDKIDVHEHRAPTDDSVRLLKELEDKALENVVLKISDTKNNKFSYNVFFSSYAVMDSLMSKGVMIIKFNCNGKEYIRKVTCSSSMLQLSMKYGPEARTIDLDMKLKKFILFEMSFLIAQILLDINDDTLKELFSSPMMSDAVKFDLDTMREELEDWERPICSPNKIVNY